jgi:hypothetical protein
MQTYKKFLLDKNTELIKKKDVSIETNNIFIDMFKNLGGFCVAHVILDKNKQIHIQSYGNISHQSNIFIKVIEDNISRYLNKISGNLSFFY